MFKIIYIDMKQKVFDTNCPLVADFLIDYYWSIYNTESGSFSINIKYSRWVPIGYFFLTKCYLLTGYMVSECNIGEHSILLAQN